MYTPETVPSLLMAFLDSGEAATGGFWAPGDEDMMQTQTQAQTP